VSVDDSKDSLNNKEAFKTYNAFNHICYTFSGITGQTLLQHWKIAARYCGNQKHSQSEEANVNYL